MAEVEQTPVWEPVKSGPADETGEVAAGGFEDGPAPWKQV